MTNATTYTVSISDASGDDVITNCTPLDVQTLKALYADAPHTITVLTDDEWKKITRATKQDVYRVWRMFPDGIERPVCDFSHKQAAIDYCNFFSCYCVSMIFELPSGSSRQDVIYYR